MMLTKKTIFIAAAFAPLALSGCKTFTDVERQIKSDVNQIEGNVKAIHDNASTGAVWRTNEPKLAGERVPVVKKAELPALFSRPFNYATSGQSFAEIAAAVTSHIGIPVRVEGALAQPASQSGQANAQNAIQNIEWSGTLKGFLDYLAQNSPTKFWKYENGEIVFFVEETRAYHVFMPTGKKSVNASISLSALGGSGASGGNVSVSSSADIDHFAAVVKGVSAIIGAPVQGTATGGAGSASSKVVANQELGLITVTAAPPMQESVGNYVDAINKRFAKNVLIDVKIYNVTLNDETSAGLSLDLVYNSLKNYGIRITGQPVLQPSIGSPASLTIENTNQNSKAFGSNLLAQALRGLGNVSLVTTGQVIAANGQPAPLQVANQVTYLASSSVTQAANVGTTNTLTPGTVTVGFTANFLPMLLGDNRILLQYQINLSSLLSLDQISSGNQVIQTPNIATQSLQQQAYVKDGQAIVLFGYDTSKSSTAKTASFAGISATASKDRLMTVIVMQVFGGSRENI